MGPPPRERKDHLDRLAITLLVLCCAFWGFQQILIKSTVAEVPPLWQASLRFAGAVVLLWLWCQWRRVPLFQKDGSLRAGLLAGLLFAGEFAFIYLGLMYTSASRLTVFLYTSPFVVALLLPRFVLSERLRTIQWAGLCVAFASVAVAFSEGFFKPAAALAAPPLQVLGLSLPSQLLGDAMALGAGILWGLTTLTIRTTLLAQGSAEKTLFYQVAVTAALAPLLSLALGETWSLQYSSTAWVSIGLQTVVGAFASYLTWMWLLRHYPATHISSFVFLTPAFALVFGVGLLGEPLTAQLLVALAGVAVGMVLLSRRA